MSTNVSATHAAKELCAETNPGSSLANVQATQTATLTLANANKTKFLGAQQQALALLELNVLLKLQETTCAFAREGSSEIQLQTFAKI